MSQTLAANDTLPVCRKPVDATEADCHRHHPDWSAVWNDPEAMRKVWRWLWGPVGQADGAH